MKKYKVTTILDVTITREDDVKEVHIHDIDIIAVCSGDVEDSYILDMISKHGTNWANYVPDHWNAEYI